MKMKWIIAALILSLSVSSVYAISSITVVHRTFNAMLAGNQQVSGDISAVDQGFFPILADEAPRGDSIATAVVFPSTPNTGIGANTALKAGDWGFTVFIQPTASTPVSTTFKVVLQISRSCSCPGLVSPLVVYIATGATVDPTTSISTSFDIGPELPTPVAYLVTIFPA